MNEVSIDYNRFLSILKKIVTEGRTKNLFHVSTYFETSQVDYVLANFLENGQCFFYDKKNACNVKQIEFEYRRNAISFKGERKSLLTMFYL